MFMYTLRNGEAFLTPDPKLSKHTPKPIFVLMSWTLVYSKGRNAQLEGIKHKIVKC